MFNLSQCKIDLRRQSSDYLRLTLLIYLGAIGVLFYSSWPPLVKFAILILLLWQLLRITRHPIPYSRWYSLNYQDEAWSLEDSKGQRVAYNKVDIILDTGFSFLLRLRAEKQQKVMVIFSDQLSTEDYQLLRLIVKIN